MKLQLIIFQLFCLAVALARPAVEEDPANEGTSQSLKSPSSRQSPLRSSRAQASPLSSKAQPIVPPQNVKQIPQLVEDEPEYVEDGEIKEYEDGSAPSSASSSTTEAPKKIGSGSVRPFRSNQDLLETLRRRRLEKAATAPTFAQNQAALTSTAAPTPASSNKSKLANSSRKYNRSKGYSAPEQLESDQTGSESEKKTTVNTNRRISGRGRAAYSNNKSSTEAYEEVQAPEEPQTQPAAQARNKSFGGRSSRRF